MIYPDPIILQVGPLAIRWYGLLIATGALLAGYIASLEAQRRGLNPDHVWNALMVVLVSGIIGARLYHVISSPAGTQAGLSYYLQNPAKIIAIWEGGLGIYGAVAGGALGLYLYARYHGLRFWQWADMAAIGLPLAQAIGRWGNFFNQELYGNPTRLPWGIRIDAAHRLPQFADLPPETRFHPTFLYESLWSLGAFLVLLFLARRYGDRLRQGDLFLIYLILYPVGRILVELQRPDAWRIAGIPTAQWVAGGLILLSLFLLWYRRRAGIPASQVNGRRQAHRRA
ncbi:MAG: prolipoprotein diacylglyceryl transferase [Anaerolineae bacterium]